MPDEADYLAKCRELIEAKLGWGESSNWQSGDYENLSEKIFEETKLLLSSSTLKRIWGKVRYTSTPNITTLNALAQFAGFDNWRAFTAIDFGAPEEKAITPEPRKKRSYKPFVFAGLLVLVIAVLAFGFIRNHNRALHFEHIQFSSKPVTLGVPNTVVFEYDVSQSNADSVFIQQSWNPKLRQRVDKTGKVFATTYYVPGYYKAKLILNDSLVEEHDVFIETSGWQGILDLKPTPAYLNNEAIRKGDSLGFSQQQIGSYYSTEAEPAFFVLANVNQSFTRIDSNHYELNMQLQNTYHKPGMDVCNKTFVSILGSNGFINIPLCNKGCVGDITLMLGNKKLSGKTNNLQNFGVNFTKKVKLRCELADKRFKIFIDDVPAYTAPDPAIGKLVGVRVAFTGSGWMNDFSLM